VLCYLQRALPEEKIKSKSTILKMNNNHV